MPLPPIPEVPSDTPKGLYNLLRAVKVTLDAYRGKGDSNDKAVTVGMLSGGAPSPSSPSPSPSIPGLGNAAYKNVGTGPNTVAAGDHAHSQYEASGAVASHESSGKHKWSAITERDEAYAVPERIAEDETFTVGLGRQLNIVGEIEVAGTLEIAGTVHVL